MKPLHEQEWKVRETNHGPVIDSDTHPEGDAVCMVYAPHYSEHRITLAQSDAIRDERAAFIAAGPRVARELLHLVRLLEPLEKDGGLDVPGLATLNGARAALRKAGCL